MAVGTTHVSNVSDSLNTVVDGARAVREYEGAMTKVVDTKSLPANEGLAWNEVTFAQLEAQVVTETTTLDNPQQFSDSLFSITPLQTGITTIVTDKVKVRIARESLAQMGALAQNAINRRKDEDGITVLDGATTSLVGTGSALTSGHISAAVTRIMGNATEPGMGQIFAVLHPLQVKDLQDELVLGIEANTSLAIPSGISQDTYRAGYQGPLFGAQVFVDGNIPVLTGDDAKGGVFTREAIVLVQGRAPYGKSKDVPEYGGGAEQLFLYDEYAYGERSAGNWLFEIFSDITVPTS